MTVVPATAICTAHGPLAWQAHATCVALDGRGLLILGRSGIGKSSMAAELIALGCGLVADDLVLLNSASVERCMLCTAPPDAPRSLELRGLGLLPVPLVECARLACCLFLSQNASPRFPPEEHVGFGEVIVPLYRSAPHAALAAHLFLLLREGGHTLRA